MPGVRWPALVFVAAVCARGQRLRVINGCDLEPIWIAHMASNAAGPDQQNVRLEPGKSYAFATTPGLSGTRYWAKMRCNDQGNECLLGESGGPQESCDLDIGCAPPIDTKFEASFGDATNPDWVDVSLVDGWTLPFKFEMSQKCSAGEGSRGIGTVVDCSSLSFAECPRAENVGMASTSPLSLEVRHPKTGGVVGCYAPCSKLTFSNWANKAAKYAPADPAAAEYCCPTPPESPKQCRSGPIKDSLFVKAVHRNCPGVYGYSYDDGMGLILCPVNTTYTMTFYCPKDLARAFPKYTTAMPTSGPQRPPGPILPGPLPPLPTIPPLPGGQECPNLVFPVLANRDHIGKWESFKVVRHTDQPLWKDLISLKTYYDRYVTAYPDGFVEARALAVTPWELFRMDKDRLGRVSFRSSSGNYLVAEYGSLHASGAELGAPAKFVQVRNVDGTIALRGSSSGKYISAERKCADEITDCLEKDRAYSPLDMPDQPTTREASAAGCQARCATTTGCGHFTFFPAGGACHLQDKWSVQLLSLGAIAGPPECEKLTTQRKDQLFSKNHPAGYLQELRHLAQPLGLSAVLVVMAFAAAAVLAVRRARRHDVSSPARPDSVGLLLEEVAS